MSCKQWTENALNKDAPRLQGISAVPFTLLPCPSPLSHPFHHSLFLSHPFELLSEFVHLLSDCIRQLSTAEWSRVLSGSEKKQRITNIGKTFCCYCCWTFCPLKGKRQSASLSISVCLSSGNVTMCFCCISFSFVRAVIDFSLFLAAVVTVNLWLAAWRFAARYVSGKKVDSAEWEREGESE